MNIFRQRYKCECKPGQDRNGSPSRRRRFYDEEYQNFGEYYREQQLVVAERYRRSVDEDQGLVDKT